MSRLAPITDNQLVAITGKALQLINKGLPGGGRLFAIKDDDPQNELQGRFLNIEAKQILIALMVSNKWDELVKFNAMVPDPATVKKDFNIVTDWQMWPTGGENEGLVGVAADAQADVVARVAFMKLMFAKHPTMASKRVKEVAKSKAKSQGTAGIRGGEFDGSTDTAMYDIGLGGFDGSAEYEPSAMGEESVEFDIAANDDEDTSFHGFEENEEEAEESGPAMEDIETEPEEEFEVHDLPHPDKVNLGFRLSRDWEYWPSIGLVDFAVSDCQQAQYAMIADVLFETMKVQGVKKATQQKTLLTAKDTAEVEGLASLTEDEIFMDILNDLLLTFLQRGGKPCLRSNHSDLDNQSDAFKRHINAQENIILTKGEQQTTVQAILQSLSAPAIANLYIAVCKAKANADKANKLASTASTSARGGAGLSGGRGGRGGRGARGARGGRGGRGGSTGSVPSQGPPPMSAAFTGVPMYTYTYNPPVPGNVPGTDTGSPKKRGPPKEAEDDSAQEGSRSPTKKSKQ